MHPPLHVLRKYPKEQREYERGSLLQQPSIPNPFREYTDGQSMHHGNHSALSLSSEAEEVALTRTRKATQSQQHHSSRYVSSLASNKPSSNQGDMQAVPTSLGIYDQYVESGPSWAELGRLQQRINSTRLLSLAPTDSKFNGGNADQMNSGPVYGYPSRNLPAKERQIALNTDLPARDAIGSHHLIVPLQNLHYKATILGRNLINRAYLTPPSYRASPFAQRPRPFVPTSIESFNRHRLRLINYRGAYEYSSSIDIMTRSIEFLHIRRALPDEDESMEMTERRLLEQYRKDHPNILPENASSEASVASSRQNMRVGDLERTTRSVDIAKPPHMHSIPLPSSLDSEQLTTDYTVNFQQHGDPSGLFWDSLGSIFEAIVDVPTVTLDEMKGKTESGMSTVAIDADDRAAAAVVHSVNITDELEPDSSNPRPLFVPTNLDRQMLSPDEVSYIVNRQHRLRENNQSYAKKRKRNYRS